MWGGSLLVTGAVFSFAQGIIHPYYSIALAPAIGALVGAGSVELWSRRGTLVARLCLAGALAATVIWAYRLLDRSPDWYPGLKFVILVAGLAATALIAALPLMSGPLAAPYRWIGATIDANSAAGYELATGDPVMAIGGFNGSDPAPTLAQFQDYVSKRQIHYFIAGGMRGSGGGSSSQIATWVGANFASTTVGGVTVYDLTQ